MKLKDGNTVTFNLRDVKVETLREAIGSASLEEGSQVTIERDDANKVKRVKARHAEVEGTVKSFDKDEKTVTISSSQKDNITLKVTDATKIEIDDDEDKAFSFANLREGQEIEAKYDVETKKALKIEIEEDGEDEDGDE